MKRRQLLLAAGAGAALGALALRPRDRGEGGHSEYFAGLQTELQRHGLARPTMLLDLDRLDHNIAEMQRWMAPEMAYRVVAKSLPSLQLLQYVMARTKSSRLMVFHQPFINQLAAQQPDADLLLGKPMPVAAAARFYEDYKLGEFQPARQLQWLIDTPERLQQYAELARAREVDMQINLEIDVGLHRGGLRTLEQFAQVQRILEAHPRLRLSGLMGYEPHVAKAPGILGLQRREFANAKQHYSAFREAAIGAGLDPAQACFNAAGSPTFRLWKDVHGLANELSVGTGLVMPTDYDIPSLDSHQPAVFIATPVLKASDGVQMPVVAGLGSLQSAWDVNRRRTFFAYGGYWKAVPVSPAGLSENPVYGRSTNQEMLNGSERVELAVDEHIFYRPTQSEFVMLQFGPLAVVRGGQIIDSWPVFA